ncbi:MAG: hypothetical protein GXY03_05270 [Solirubrobacterales bacterium]|nr:hypothetical protein [Solirubrobacterales bacterium]
MAALHDDLAAEFAATAEEILSRLDRNRTVTGELEAGPFSATAWSAVAEAGWLEALVTEEAGGLGLGLRELAPILTAVGRHLLPGPVAEHAVAGALAVPAAADSAAARLRATLAGEGMLALVDPAAASPAAARPRLAGDELSGGCELVRFAGRASELLVAADGPDGPAVVLLDAGRDGVAVAARESLDPTTELSAVTLDGVAVGADDVVAANDVAAELLRATHAGMRVAVACELAGIADHALTISVAYAKEREQFGRPIGSFQALQHILAEMARESFALGRTCREAAAADAGAPDRLDDAALAAKAYAARAARSVVESALQVHGGIAFTIEHELHRYYTHLLFLDGFWGDRRDLHAALGRRLLAGDGDVWPAWS